LVLAVKVPEAAFAPIVTEAGMLNAAEAVLDSATTLPAADLERVTVQVVLAFDIMVAAVHWRLERVTGDTGATSESTVDLEEPFEAAVIVADWSEVKAPALAVKVAETAFATTFTEAGMVKAEDALVESATTVLLPVEFDSVTVQMVLVFEVRLVAVQRSEDTVGEAGGAGCACNGDPVTVNSSMMSSVELYPP
jgi:hypothetical protein